MGAVVASASTQTSSGTSMVITKPSGTVEGDLLVAFVVNDNDGAFVNMTPGAGFTELSNSGSVATTAGFGKIFTCTAGPSEPSTYTFGGSSTSENTMAMLRITGAGGISAAPVWFYSSASGATSLSAPSVTTASTGVLLCGFTVESITAGATITPPSGMSGTSFLGPAPFVMELFASQAGVAAGATGTKTATSSAGTPSLGYFTVSMGVADATPVPQEFRRRQPVPPTNRRRSALVITPTAAAAPAIAPAAPFRRRPALAITRRARVASPPRDQPMVVRPSRGRTRPVVARPARMKANAPPLAQPSPSPQVRRRGLGRPRPHGSSITPVPVQVAVPPIYPPGRIAARVRELLPRRVTRAQGPVPDQVSVIAPSYPPSRVAARVRAVGLRRARVSGPASGAETPVPASRARTRQYLTRRGRPISPVPVQVAVPPVYPPGRIRQPWRAPFWRRGHAVGPVPDQVTFAAMAYPPSRISARVRVPFWRRPRASGPIPDQVAVVALTYPPSPAHTRARVLLGRRSRMVAPVPAQAVAPASLASPRRVGRLLRRPRTPTPVPAQTPAVTALAIPGRRPPRGAVNRRARAVAPPLLQAQPPAQPRARLGGRQRRRTIPPMLVPASAPLPAPARSASQAVTRRRIPVVRRGHQSFPIQAGAALRPGRAIAGLRATTTGAPGIRGTATAVPGTRSTTTAQGGH